MNRHEQINKTNLTICYAFWMDFYSPILRNLHSNFCVYDCYRNIQMFFRFSYHSMYNSNLSTIHDDIAPRAQSNLFYPNHPILFYICFCKQHPLLIADHWVCNTYRVIWLKYWNQAVINQLLRQNMLYLIYYSYNNTVVLVYFHCHMLGIESFLSIHPIDCISILISEVFSKQLLKPTF